VNGYLNSPIFICDYFYWRPPPAYPLGDENHIKIKPRAIKHLKTNEINDRIVSLSSDVHQRED